MPLNGPEICQLEYYLYPFYLWFYIYISSIAEYSVEFLGIKLWKERKYNIPQNTMKTVYVLFSVTRFDIVGRREIGG